VGGPLAIQHGGGHQLELGRVFLLQSEDGVKVMTLIVQGHDLDVNVMTLTTT